MQRPLLLSSPRRRLLGASAIFVALLFLGRGLLAELTFSRAGAEMKALGRWLEGDERPGAKGEGVAADPTDLGPLLSWLEAVTSEPEADESPAGQPGTGGTPGARNAKSVVRLGPEPPPSVYLSEQSVLRLAEAGTIPRGVGRPAAWGMPPGIEIVGGAGLGIGWFPGDRLTHVEGVPVLDRSLVIQKVLERRAEGAAVISGTLARRTRAGVKSWTIVVEQPYLSPGQEEAQEPSQSAVTP